MATINYREVSAEGRYFQALGRRAVVAVRGRAGSIDSAGPEEELVPFFKRYFLGRRDQPAWLGPV